MGGVIFYCMSEVGRGGKRTGDKGNVYDGSGGDEERSFYEKMGDCDNDEKWG